MKIIILVLSAEMDPYASLETTIRNTWAKEKLPEIEVFYYYGNGLKKEIIGDKIYSEHSEGLYNIGYKTLDAFELIQNFDFDYLFRTNSSSYINQKNLLKFIENKPKENFYCGISVKNYGINYCSGSGYFLSKDLIKKILFLKKQWNHNLIDDVAIRDLIVNKIGIPLDDSGNKIDLNDNEYSFENIKDYYHFRCKFGEDRRIDIKHMNQLFNLLNK